eukprot:6866429-Alexandrium_andersonii.AAC.1
MRVNASPWGKTTAQNMSERTWPRPWGGNWASTDRRPASTIRSWSSSPPQSRQGRSSSSHQKRHGAPWGPESKTWFPMWSKGTPAASKWA